MSARLVTMSRPNDEDIRIPANGFSLAGTVSKPANATGKLPAVILVSGSDPTDRDENVFGIPIFGQIADALADAGFIVLRYDKRGVGQSGGRTEAARLEHFAEDAKAAVKAMSERKDVDRKRVAIVGHARADDRADGRKRQPRGGCWTGVGRRRQPRELNSYRVAHGLSDRRVQRRSDRQRLTCKTDSAGGGHWLGWDQIKVPEAIRHQADTPFPKFFTLDPARPAKDVQQPLLIVEGNGIRSATGQR